MYVWLLWNVSRRLTAVGVSETASICVVYEHIPNWIFSLHYFIWQVSAADVTGSFIGAFTRMRKATISFVMFVCLSVRMEHLGSHWTGCHEIRYLRIFRKSIEKIQALLKSEKNNGYFT
jgi:hypothetical protein